ncbi:hypothetical protein JCM3774_002701 [Rhodotorula dairenensis]
MAVSDATDKQSHDGIDSARIGWAFLSQYYSYLNKDPARLHCFYTKRSTLLHSTEGEDATACYGQQEIHAKIMSLQFDDCKVYISNVDSQSSAEGGIIVQVIGEMSNANGPWRKFAQTFFLAGQHNGYFVLNDICRYIKEEGDEDAEPFAPPRPATPVDAPASTLPPAASVESVLFDETNGAKTVSHAQSSQPAESRQPETRPEDSFTFHSDVLAPAALNGTEAETSEGQAHVRAEESAPQEAPREAAERESAPPGSTHPVESAETVNEVPPQIEAEEPQEKAQAPAPVQASTEPTTAAEPASAEGTAQVPGSATAATTTTPSGGNVAAATVSSPAAPSPAPAPAAPKSWASLAAAGSTKWGKVTSEAKGVSAAVPQAAPAAERTAPITAGPAVASSSPAFTEAVLAVKTPSCFVKGVVEAVTDQMLRDTLTTRFGPLKEFDIVRSKACAFIEFEKLDHARKAIQVSMRPSEGGEGAIFITAEPGGAQHRINVVERKPHDQRPVSKRGGGAMGGTDRGGFRTAGASRDNNESTARGGRNGGSPSTRGGRGGGRGGARGGGATSSK